MCVIVFIRDCRKIYNIFRDMFEKKLIYFKRSLIKRDKKKIKENYIIIDEDSIK